MASNEYQLIKKVLENSVSDSWVEAVSEWDIFDCELDYEQQSKCICGKENIKYLFTIKNKSNDLTLFPIGSECIKKFGRSDLNEIINVYERKYKLLKEFKKGNYIEFTSKLFSKKSLKFMYEDGCFKPSKYNHFDPYTDYKFMLDMFNKRNPLTEKQDSKVRAIIMTSIRPYLEKTLKFKND